MNIALVQKFRSLLAAENPDYDEIRRTVLAAYREDTSDDIPDDIAANDARLKAVVLWCNQNHDEFSGYVRKPTLQNKFSPCLSSKIGSFAQHHCLLCNPSGSIHTIPIRIRPLSHQNKKRIKKDAFKIAIASKFADKKLLAEFAGKSLCVHILFVVNPDTTPSDIDNLAKLLNDSFIGYVYDDDSAIDHLSLMRISHTGDEEYIYVRISDTGINEHHDVLYHGMLHSWGGAPELVIEDFYES
jgi:Holliday junction resolvase RusA-like endonuclease